MNRLLLKGSQKDTTVCCIIDGYFDWPHCNALWDCLHHDGHWYYLPYTVWLLGDFCIENHNSISHVAISLLLNKKGKDIKYHLTSDFEQNIFGTQKTLLQDYGEKSCVTVCIFCFQFITNTGSNWMSGQAHCIVGYTNIHFTFPFHILYSLTNVHLHRNRYP